MDLRFDAGLRKELVAHCRSAEPKLDAVERRLAELFEYYLEPNLLPVGPAMEALPFETMIKAYLEHAEMSIGRRLGILLDDFVHLANTKRLHSLAMVARALIETTSKLVVLREDLERTLSTRLERDRIKEDLLDKIDAVNLGGRFDWKSYFKSPDKLLTSFLKTTKGLEPDIKATNVLGWVEKLNRRHGRLCDGPGQVNMLYALLSDIVHPGLGGEVLLITQPPAGLKNHVLFAAQPPRENLYHFMSKVALPAAEICCAHMLALEQLRQINEGIQVVTAVP